MLLALLKALGRKIPCIPPLFHDNKVIADLKEKSEIFNCFIAKQCSSIDNKNALLTPYLLQTNHSRMLISRWRIRKTYNKNAKPNKDIFLYPKI